MPPPLCQSDSTYTFDRVRQILEDSYYVALPDGRDKPAEFIVMQTGFEHKEDNSLVFHEAKGQRERALMWCRAYCEHIQNPIDHLRRLDLAYSNLLQCNFKPPEHAGVVEKACRLLQRLPATPPMLGEHWASASSLGLHDEFFLPGSSQIWENLRVVRFVDTNVIRLALQIEMAGETWWGGIFTKFVDTIAELLKVTIELSTAAQPPTPEWLILQEFLWTSWQRALMLHFSYVLGVQLNIGYDYGRNGALGVDIIPIIQKALRPIPSRGLQAINIAYMCNWAFELLRSDRASVALDFRTFNERFAQLFGHLPPRCIASEDGATQQCKGDSPGSCTRFKGMKIEDQSAHAAPCPGNCRKLFWSEQSFRSQHGARAVLLEASNQSSLRYCTASNRTMAISHVWSHGQGGRPEFVEENGTGFNSCLHNRYRRIAESFECDSYWMDTPCIPQNHELRREAIENINSVFLNSKLTLICDRDLMVIDVNSLTLELQESLLAALLVCDWNVRAWTLLEAMRGRSNIHLLCKDDRVVCLKEIFETVHQRGSITISMLFVTAQHLMPAQPPPVGATPSPFLTRRAMGFVNVEEAACLLSHRHASRKNDEVIIWSLLCDDDVSETALGFWKTRIDHIIPTGFLISSTPRIRCDGIKAHRGFGWAPCRPDMPDDLGSSKTKVYFAYDGTKSADGLITDEGLRATWLVMEFRANLPLPSVVTAMLTWGRSQTIRTLWRITSRYLKAYKWGALLQPAHEINDDPVQYRGNTDGPMVAIVGSHDRQSWHWVCVYEWDEPIPLPSFQRKEILLV